MRFTVQIDELIQEVHSLPKEQFIYEGVKENSLAMIVASPKVGKTTFAENLALSIASGCTKYLGKDVWADNNRRVMIISLEEFYRSRTARNSAQIEYLDAVMGGSEWHSNVFTASKSIPRYIETPGHWDQLLGEINEVQPAFTVIDSLSRLHGTDSIEDSSTGIALMKKLRNIVDKSGTTLTVIHHTNKAGTGLLTQANMAGTRVLAQEVDALIGMSKTPSGKRYIKPLAYRYADDSSELVQLIRRTPNHWLESAGFIEEYKLLRENDQRIDDTNVETVLEYFSEYTKGDCAVVVETKNLMEDLVDRKIMAKPTLHKALNKLIDDGAIQKHDKGIYTLPQG